MGEGAKGKTSTIEVVPANVPTCACNFADREAEREARRQFLKDYGDNRPDPIINDMVSDELWDAWATLCDCNDPTRIFAVAHYEPTDWYLCTIKGLAVKPEERRKGLGREVAGKVIKEAQTNPNCLVLAADVTFDNIASQKSLTRYGFEPVGEFCWGKGEKPADILLHLVRFKPTEDKTCLEP